jgi:hypothetical protein
MSILLHSDIDHKKINYSKPEKQGQIYYSAINYDNSPFYLQTSKMVCKKSGDEIAKMKNAVLEMDNITMDFGFYDTLLNLDERNVKKTHENNKDWFGKDIPLEVIDNMYKRSCKPVKKSSKPNFSFKIPMIKDKVQCHIYDQKKVCVDIGQLKEGTEVICILHVRGLKFLKQHYYCDCYISQIKVLSPDQSTFTRLDTYSFNDKAEEEAELLELEKELLLDPDYIESIRNKEVEREKIQKELDLAKSNLLSQQELIGSLEQKLSEF